MEDPFKVKEFLMSTPVLLRSAVVSVMVRRRVAVAITHAFTVS